MKTLHSKPPDRADNPNTIWVFTPSRTDPKDLEFILVQRQKLLQDAVERVKESALTDHKHYLLFVGPRGCGKTHLVTLIVNRLSADDELTDRLRIAWLTEDETCTTLLEFFCKIHLALEKRYPEAYRNDMLSAAFDMKQDAALAFVSQHLLSSLGARTLLVVAENLDAIFEGLGDAGQKQLRSFIQENPQLFIVATAQRLVKDLSSRTSPFFGFFQTEHLQPLNVEQATELLQNIARLQENSSIVEFLATSRGRCRVRAIHHLAGGNQRIYIVLSQFITRDSVDALLEPFMKMVDELTPYYQERIRWLPPMQRKIVEYLCIREGTVPVKEIARRLFATPQTISSQLQDLREKGYVEANHRGRESLYEISEPLMRICVQMKDNQRLQPLRLLVNFLRVWYDEQHLKDRRGQAGAPQHTIADRTTIVDLSGASVVPDANELYLSDVTHFPKRSKNASLLDDEAWVRLPEAPLEHVVEAHLAVCELHFSEGRWSEGFQALEASLASGSKAHPVYRGNATGLTEMVFSAGLNPEGRRAKVVELCRLYDKHQALPVLGAALVQHLGRAFRAGAPFPSADNLEGWASAWEQAATNMPDFCLSVRLLRTGTDYVKVGGNDPGILLGLTSPERAILAQSFGLAQKDAAQRM